ncbi:MAG: septum formation protein Maf [Alphaproteobacteria bacterium]|nr:septum formation protein Maf [Alphaproteobacteria bacterium]MBV9694133.1 septum formation protein Maf [Alphaproteobacteria bacterium]
MTVLVLASASTARARLLADAGIPFRQVTSDIDEAALKREGGPAPDIALGLAAAKAAQVSAGETNALVLGADQVLLYGDRLLSKAQTPAEALEQLRELRGRSHTLISALCLAQRGTVLWKHVEQARLWMRPFSDAILQTYVAGEGSRILASVGCYQLEGPGIQLFERIEGDFFAVLGLPLLPLLAELRRHGVVAS